MPRNSRSVTVISAISAVAVLTGPLPPAQATPLHYVALGDSYSAGTGTRDYLPGSRGCERSSAAYPSLLAASLGFDLSLRACSGAKIETVAHQQLDTLEAGTDYVTITVGGGDAAYTRVLTTCGLPSWLGNCPRALASARRFIDGTLPGRLRALFRQIRAAAPNAHVVVVGYPRLFNGRDCNAGTWFSSREIEQLNSTADLLDLRISEQARSTGFAFADPRDAFTGRAVCDNPEWLNGLSVPVGESFHPNTAGQAGYADVVGEQLTGRPLPASSRRIARTHADQAAIGAARSSTRTDVRVEPGQYQAPDLTTPGAVSAAHRARVDLDSPASMAAVDRAVESRQWASSELAVAPLD